MNRASLRAGVEAGGCAAAVGLTGLLYLDFFTSKGFLLAVLAVVLAAAACGWLVGSRRPVLLVAVGVLGFATVAVLAALRDTLAGWLPTGRTWSELAWGVAGGWARMLSVSLPATVDGEMLVAVLFVSWTACYVAVILALRTTAPLAPAVPPVAALGFGLVMVASQPRAHLLVASGLAAVLVTLTLLRAHRAANASMVESTLDGRPRHGLLVGSLVVAVVVAAGFAGGASGVLGAGERRADPRPLYAEALRNPRVVSPLAGVKAQLIEDPPRHLFSVALQQVPADVIGIRLASLDRFDGALWTNDDDFLVAGERLRPDPSLAQPKRLVVQVTIDDLRSPFLPAIGWPVGVRYPAGVPSRLGFSSTSGSLIVEQAAPAGTTYEVTGEYRPARDVDRAATANATAVDGRYLEVPEGMPPFVAALARQVADREPSPIGKLTAIEGHLRELPYNLDVAPGHSYAAVGKLLGAAHDRDDEAYAEQHAAAFAVLARSLGYPARVAVGYRLRNGHDGTFEVTTRDVHAWAEVHFDRYGWVAFDPTDPERKRTRPPQQVGATPKPTPAPTDPGTRSQPAAPPIPPPNLDQPHGIDALTVFRLGLLGLAALILLGILAVLTEKARRRWRRRHARSVAMRVIGAWQEVVDRFTELRLPMTFASTPLEFADRATMRFGDRARMIAELAEPATAAVFGPGQLAEEDAHRAWRLERGIRRDLYRGWHGIRRIDTQLNPRPLFRRRTRKRRA